VVGYCPSTAAGIVCAAIVQEFPTEQTTIIGESIADHKAIPWQTEHESQGAAPERLHHFAATGQHGPAVPSGEPISAAMLFHIARDLPSRNRGTECGKLPPLVFENANFELPLPHYMSGSHFRISLN
jgi:hypothetical protein